MTTLSSTTTSAQPGIAVPRTGFLAEYFALSGRVDSLSQINFLSKPVVKADVAALNTVGSVSSFWAGGPTDLFAARYTGDLSVSKAGKYTFFLTSDDGSALYIDGKRIIANDGDHGAREIRTTLDLGAGVHRIEVRYFENFGKQTLKLEWQGGDTGGLRKVLSGTAIAPPNEAPQSVNDTATTSAGNSVLVNVLANDRDIDSDKLSVAAVTQPGNGTVTIENGQVRYVPKAGFTGEDKFGYMVSDGRGGSANGTVSVSVTANAPVADAAAGKLGLAVSYFDLDAEVNSLADVNFNATPAATSTASSLNYLQTVDPFWANGPADMFAARYTGDLNVTKAGTYTFYLTSDDGSALYIDGKLVINNDGGHGPLEKTASLNLASGAHDIELRYFENSGSQTLKLEWKGPDSAGVRGVISGDRLSHEESVTDEMVHHAGLLADYYRLSSKVTSLSQIDFGATPIHEGGVTQLNSLHTNQAFWQGGATDLFAARYTGDLNVVNAGKYTLFLTSDDGSELYIDGRKVISNDGDHGAREIKVTLNLSAGAHDIEIRYFENFGHQTLKFEWQGPDSDGQREVVSGTSLSHDGPIHAGDPGPCPDDGGAVCQCGCGTDDGMTGGDTDHDHGTDSPDGGLPLPKTAAEADAYVAKVKALPESHDHEGMEGMTPGMVKEHDALLDLVPRAEATHVAIANGDWFDPDTWYEGRIPDAGAKVLIPQGVSVTYDGESNASLFTVRVDGELSFATDANTKMVVDTMVVSGTGRLEIGTDDNPVDAGVSTKILIANNGDIDVGWDPMLLSRGIVSLGEVEIHGAEKTTFLKVADAPMKGDTVIDLAEVPEGWKVGDTIVVSGTHKTGWTWDHKLGKKVHIESQDEEVQITKIEGGKITIDRPLSFDHDTPREDLFAYVANMTRNVTIASEDGEATAVHHRGHTMFMHNDAVDVRYAAFDDLGRTDKSEDAFDIGKLATVEADSNIKGRYSFHFHKTGTTDQENPAMAVGNALSGSPGWGFVHHSSNANFTDNVAFDVFGAAFAAEDGDETGIWLRNMAIRSEGIAYGDSVAKDQEDVARHDNGRTGDGFFFAGRLVEVAENVAVNTTHGYTWMSRGALANPLAGNLGHPEVAYGRDSVSVDTPQIEGFRDNEAFGTQIGLVVVKLAAKQNHDVRTVMDGFLNWETSSGAIVSYTAHYTMKNFDLIATSNNQAVAGPQTGFDFSSGAYDIVANNIKIEGFRVGVDWTQSINFEIPKIDNIIIDGELIGNIVNHQGFDPTQYRIMSSDDLVENRLSFNLETSTTLSKIDHIFLEGTKTDSIGTIDRGFGKDLYDIGRQFLDANGQVLPLMQKEGYYKTADGKKVFLIEDFVADRATGELFKIAHVYTLEMTDDRLASLGVRYNGTIELGGRAPIVGNDVSSVQADQDLYLNVLSNDRDPEGGLLRVDGFTDPVHGDVFLQDNGTLLYRPDLGFAGTDTFSYWAADDDGNFTKATVTIDVWDV